MKNFFAIYFLIYQITVILVGLTMILLTVYRFNQVYLKLVFYVIGFILVIFSCKYIKNRIVELRQGNKKINIRDITSLGLLLFSMINSIFIFKEEVYSLIFLITYLFLILNCAIFLIFYKKFTL